MYERQENGWYGDLERRVLDHHIRNPDATTITVDRSHELLLAYLVKDGLLEEAGLGVGAIWVRMGHGEKEPRPGDTLMGPVKWRLTEDGRDVVDALRSAKTLD